MTGGGQGGSGADPAGAETSPESESDRDFVLRLADYEGPIALLLDQARAQKVDLTRISVLDLADQYLAFVERARRLRLELAADYLVMAAWLAYLKSRLLLPSPPEDDEPSGEVLAETLALQLRRLDAMRSAGERLMARPRLGIDRLARAMPADGGTDADPGAPPDGPRFDLTLHDLLRAYAGHLRRQGGVGALRVEASDLMSVDQALKHMVALLGGRVGWTELAAFLPPLPRGPEQAQPADPLRARAALAATFVASLELTRTGAVTLRQHGAFAPIHLRRCEPQPGPAGTAQS